MLTTILNFCIIVVYRNKKMLTAVLFASLLVSVYGHGYFVSPESRISKCNHGQARTPGLWHPPGGSGMPDPGCREAFQATGHWPSFTDRMAYRFVWRGADRASLESGRLLNVTQVCSVGGRFPAADVVTKWSRTPIRIAKSHDTVVIDFEFCATAPHNPARWFFYHHKHDVLDVPMRWDTLDFIGELDDTPLIRSPTPVPNCFTHDDPHNGVYRFKFPLPVARRGTYVIVWYAGAFFQHGGYVQCIDYEAEVSPNGAGVGDPMYDPYNYDEL